MKSGISIAFILIAAFYFLSFSLTKSEAAKIVNEDYSSVVNIDSLYEQEVNVILRTNCYVCHNPKIESHDDILAPPLVGIKHKYQKSYSDREEFINKVTKYILNPSEDEALMRGPIRRFGIMPNTVLTETDVREVVTYLYDNNLETPVWFAEHFEEKHGEKWKQK